MQQELLVFVTGVLCRNNLYGELMGFNMFIGILQRYLGLLVCCSVDRLWTDRTADKDVKVSYFIIRDTGHLNKHNYNICLVLSRVRRECVRVVHCSSWVTNKDTDVSSQGCPAVSA